MHEEVNDKTISLCIKGGKISGNILKAALKKFASETGKNKTTAQTQKLGKQSLKTLVKEGSQLSNIEITDNNIKSFERVARKYSIAYSLKKDVSTDPPRYMVFFRAKDVDVMTAAFKEYAGISAEKEKKPKVSIRKKLQVAKDRAAQHREREKEKSKDRGQSL